MTIIAQRLKEITIGKRQHYRNLTMFPLVEENPRDAYFLLLNEALESGQARVTEVSTAGSVPELKFINDGKRPVLLLDGEELVGAKQNRIVNLTIMVPARTTIVIPVSCVEQGRWHAESDTFKTTRRTHFATGRSRKARRVTEAMNRSGSRRTDQGEIWQDIEIKANNLGVNSPTGAAAAIYEHNRSRLDRYREAFQPVANQTGALFAINGRAVGFDLFDSIKPLQTMLSGLVQSYALDAIDTDSDPAPAAAPTETAASMLADCAEAIANRFPAVGAGRDIRLQGNGVAGGGLVVEERVIHLCAFRVAEENHTGRNHHGGKFSRLSDRRQHWME